MLKRIKITGYKSLVEVELVCRPLTVLFGPNAAGKSNFLDALQLLSRLVTCPSLKEAFEPPYRGKPLESFSFGPEGIPGLLRQETVAFTIEADVQLSPAAVQAVGRQIAELRRTMPPEANQGPADDDGQSFVRERNLRYRIAVEIAPRTGILRVADEYLAALNTRGQPARKRKPFLERAGQRLRLRMEGQDRPSYHERYLDHSILSLPLYPPHYPHLVAMRQELVHWLFYYFEPRERMRAASPIKEVRHIGLMGEELAAYLNTLRALDEKQFRAIEKSLQLLVPSISGIDVRPNDFGEVELRLREGNRLIPARIISEGTLRVLGLLALGGAKEPPAVVGIEEPENGIHPGRIELVAEYLKSRAEQGDSQLIVTTHSPTLLDMLPDESLFVCRNRDGQTTIEPYQGLELFRTDAIREALDATDEPLADQRLPVSARILRGDFNA
jgi:predicted ATPase